MKIDVDFDLCEANGVCVDICPDVFDIDDDNFLQVNHDAVTSDTEEALRSAARGCPRGAIRVVE